MTHPSITIDPDDKHILSATDAEAILFGHNNDDVPCILHVSREVYHAAIDDWLDHKANYNQNGGFAGVGCIYFEDAELIPEAKGWLHSVSFGLIKPPEDDDEDSDVWSHQTAVPTYRATQFNVDMEHG